MAMTEQIGIVSLGEAGNFGDDLILIAAISAVSLSQPESKIDFLSAGFPIDWDKIRQAMPIAHHVEAINRNIATRHFRGARLFSDHSRILFGGGGLLQDSHHRYRPFHWLHHISGKSREVPVLAVGIGVGPLKRHWVRELSRASRPFNACFVRDQLSEEYAQRQLGWDVERSRDFVDKTFLDQLGILDTPQSLSPLLGVALRAWPGLEPRELAAHIDSVASDTGSPMVRFYVLEAKFGSGPDVEFSELVRQHMRRQSDIKIYSGANLIEFARDMATCTHAVSMKLHSNALWTASGARIYPILYAPKTAAFFGRPFRGLEVLKSESVRRGEPPEVPRAQAVVSDWLSGGLGTGGRDDAFTRRRFAGLYVSNLALRSTRRAWRIVRAGCSKGRIA